ncbi:MAG: shikimate dehydrogenase [Rhizobiales bacterium]|nr:shikimate dehydrogenase [Hyphomicrobiales bacterium]
MDVRLDGETQVFFIVGDPIAQVKSPTLLTQKMVENGANALLVPAHVAPDGFAGFVAAAKLMQNVGGIVITVPHKPAALKFCDQITDRARYAGSVNVMVRQIGGNWLGDNTDGLGYLGGIRALGYDVKGKRSLLIGVGGAGAAIAYELLAQGVAHLAIHELNEARSADVIARLSEAFPGKVSKGSADPSGFDLICNATPVGMRESDPTPVQVEKLIGHEFVADSITKPEITPMLVAACAKGCNTMPGLGMFNAQADILVDFLVTTETT